MGNITSKVPYKIIWHFDFCFNFFGSFFTFLWFFKNKLSTIHFKIPENKIRFLINLFGKSRIFEEISMLPTHLGMACYYTWLFPSTHRCKTILHSPVVDWYNFVYASSPHHLHMEWNRMKTLSSQKIHRSLKRINILISFNQFLCKVLQLESV